MVSGARGQTRLCARWQSADLIRQIILSAALTAENNEEQAT